MKTNYTNSSARTTEEKTTLSYASSSSASSTATSFGAAKINPTILTSTSASAAYAAPTKLPTPEVSSQPTPMKEAAQPTKQPEPIAETKPAPIVSEEKAATPAAELPKPIFSNNPESIGAHKEPIVTTKPAEEAPVATKPNLPAAEDSKPTAIDNGTIGVKPPLSTGTQEPKPEKPVTVDPKPTPTPTPEPTPEPEAGVIHVHNAAELMAALKTVQGGETIKLASGDYGTLMLDGTYNKALKNLTTLDEPVTITSANTNDMATFNNIDLRGVTNLTFDSIDISLTTYRMYDSAFSVGANSSHIVLQNSSLSSNASVENAVNTRGISVSNTEHVVIHNNSIENFGWGSGVGKSSYVTVSGNTYSGVLADNAQYGADIHHIQVLDNVLYAPVYGNPLNTHQDNIQFWTTAATQSSTDIVIRGNEIYNYNAAGPDGAHGVQSIFVRGDYLNGPNGENLYRFEGMVIEDNVVVGNLLQGINVSGADGLVINNNTVLYNGASETPLVVNIPIIAVGGSTNVLIHDNVSNGVSVHPNMPGQATLDNNVIIDRVYAESPNYIGNLFVGGDKANYTIDDLLPLPGSVLDMGNGQFIGAKDLQPSATEPTPIPVASHEILQGHFVYTLDASHSLGVNGASLDGATYTWTLGDGTVLHGETVRTVFDQGGNQDVTLTVTDKNGVTNSITHELTVRNTHALHLDFNNGQVVDTTGSSFALTGVKGNEFVAGEGGKALHLGSTDFINLSKNTNMAYNSEFSFSISAKLDAGKTSGTLIGDHGKWALSIHSKDILQFAADGKWHAFKVPGANFGDNQWHDFGLTIDGDRVVVYADGRQIGSVETADALLQALQMPNNAGLTVGGNPWGNALAATIDNVDIYTVALTADQMATLHANPQANNSLFPPLSLPDAQTYTKPIMSTGDPEPMWTGGDMFANQLGDLDFAPAGTHAVAETTIDLSKILVAKQLPAILVDNTLPHLDTSVNISLVQDLQPVHTALM